MTLTKLAIARPRTTDEATALARDGRFSLPLYKAGAIDVVDHIKEGLLEPDLLIDVRAVTRARPEKLITRDGMTIRIHAGATLAEIAASPIIREHAPSLAQAAESAATPQVRNVATIAGNLLQRPRCWYYRSAAFDCLKKGGARCFAADGENKFHAIFGEGPCYIVHPSNLAPPLHVMGATLHLAGGDRRSIPIADLYHMPAENLRTEHVLQPGELVTSITLSPAAPGGFYSIKEKQSFDWPLVFAAATVSLERDAIRYARVCAGAVAPVPWPLPDVERALRGVRVDDEDELRDACAIASEGANPLAQNAYKLKLLPVAVRRAVLKAAGRTPEDLS